MDKQTILARVDHTLLSPAATWEQVRQLCDEGLRYRTASVCIPAVYVQPAAAYLHGRLPVCTVIGFPTGYSVPEIKCAEAARAVADGADEVDMVLHIGGLKMGQDAAVEQEIRQVKAACGEHILKVIVETCLLTEEEKRRACRIVSRSGAEYIKTSTGFSTGGATADDVRLLRACCPPHVKVKAAGGIASLADAEEFIRLGADRLGTSRVVKIAMAQEQAAQNGAAPDAPDAQDTTY